MDNLTVVNPFILDVDEYKRDLNFVKHYVEQMTLFLVRDKGISHDEARAFVISKLPKDEQGKLKDVPLTHTYRKKNGDREVVTTGMMSYIQDTLKNRDILSPTFTRYVHPDIRVSPLVTSIDDKVALRNVNRRASREAQARAGGLLVEVNQLESAGKTEEAKLKKIEYVRMLDLAIYKNNEQTGNKLSNNALSGAHVSSSTPLANRSAHPSLTSTCRLTSGYGNANNEKLVAGNRHYRNPSIVMNNLISIIYLTNMDELQAILTKYEMYIPTVQDVMTMVRRCSSYYWKGEDAFQYIERFVSKLEPIERAAVLYIGDLYQIKEHNPDLVRTFITQLKHRVLEPLPFEEAKKVTKEFNSDYMALVNQLQGNDMIGVTNQMAEESNPVLYGQIAATLLNVNTVLTNYSDFIKTFLVTKNMPSSIAYLPSMIRYTAITSDTDSTIFTVQDWAKWYSGEYIVNEETIGVAACVVFIASQSITHILAMMSANLGVAKERLFQIGMKNEFRFDVFSPTQETKHYYSIYGCQDGNVLADFKTEVKGVHLRNSALPPAIMEAAANKMREICVRVSKGEKISIVEELQYVADKELEILQAIRRGDSNYFKLEKVGAADSYKQGEQAHKYVSYTLWRDVFADKYGACEVPPYTAYKVNTTITSPTVFNEWLDNMEDQNLARRFKDWMIKTGKREVKTFYLPMSIVDTVGIPDEIFSLIDTRRIIVDNVSVFYKVLETLGFYQLDDRINRLIMDIPEFSQHSTSNDLKLKCVERMLLAPASVKAA